MKITPRYHSVSISLPRSALRRWLSLNEIRIMEPPPPPPPPPLNNSTDFPPTPDVPPYTSGNDYLDPGRNLMTEPITGSTCNVTSDPDSGAETPSKVRKRPSFEIDKNTRKVVTSSGANYNNGGANEHREGDNNTSRKSTTSVGARKYYPNTVPSTNAGAQQNGLSRVQETSGMRIFQEKENKLHAFEDPKILKSGLADSDSEVSGGFSRVFNHDNPEKDRDHYSEDDDEIDDEEKARSVALSASTGTSGSEMKRLHPFVRMLIEGWNTFLGMRGTRFILNVLGQQRTVILFWLAVMIIVHGAVSAMLILSLTIVMPGIWVYNAMQLFVMFCAILSYISGNKLSEAIRTSMAATDLVRGLMRMPEMKDFWNIGPNSPGYSVYRLSNVTAILAEAIIVACILLFQWQDVPTFIKTGLCTPPNYEGVKLPNRINLGQFLLGDLDLAACYNYGLPLNDGILGGWPGWPLSSPGQDYQIKGDGPLYLISSLCDNGTPGPNVSMADYGVRVIGQVVGSDAVSFQTDVTFMYPPQTIIDDVTGKINEGTYVQRCMVEVYIGSGNVKVEFTIDQYGSLATGSILEVHTNDGNSAIYPNTLDQFVRQFKPSFVYRGKDVYGVTHLVKDAVSQVFGGNHTYFPAQGTISTNILQWQLGEDGLYHTANLERGLGVSFAGLGHYALMQFNSNETIACSYFGMSGQGILLIPPIAVILAAAGSGVAIFVKMFEIM
ncbi:hypothetical protein HDU76_000440, partial [Blyttiomyces sp. JEL0837]